MILCDWRLYIYLLHKFQVKGNEMTLEVKEKRVKCAKYI